MKDAESAALTEAARQIKDGINWADYPHLRQWYEHRPAVNVYWHELARLIVEWKVEPAGTGEKR